jgi:hypothetical protein
MSRVLVRKAAGDLNAHRGEDRAAGGEGFTNRNLARVSTTSWACAFAQSSGA